MAGRKSALGAEAVHWTRCRDSPQVFVDKAGMGLPWEVQPGLLTRPASDAAEAWLQEGSGVAKIILPDSGVGAPGGQAEWHDGRL